MLSPFLARFAGGAVAVVVRVLVVRVSFERLLASFEIVKLWKASEEKPPFVTTRCGKTRTTETSKYQIALASSETLRAPSESAPLRY